MAQIFLPDDFVLEVVRVFRSGDRKSEPAAAVAEQGFLTKAGESPDDYQKAQEKLSDDAAISAFIEEVRTALVGSENRIATEFQTYVKESLSQIAGTTEQSLVGQGVIRSEFSLLLQGMHRDFQALIGTMHGDSTQLFAEMRLRQEAIAEATTKNLDAAAKIQEATTKVETATTAIQNEVPKIAVHAETAARGTTRRAAMATAFIVSPIAIITGFAGNKFTNWWDGPAHQTQSAPPFELHLQVTSADARPSLDIKALQSGKTVTIRMPNQKIELNIAPPIISQTIVVQPGHTHSATPSRRHQKRRLLPHKSFHR